MEEREVNKVRAVIINEKGQILVERTQEGAYMLPGGKIEKGEQVESALKREIQEESGIVITNEDIKGQFCKGIYYAHKIDKDTNEEYMKKTNTSFYLAYTDKSIDETKIVMSEREKARGQRPEYINISILRYQLEQQRNETKSSMEQRYAIELLAVLEKFKEYVKQQEDRTR